MNTLDVIARHPDRFRVLALTAHRRLDLLFDQAMAFAPRLVVIDTPADAKLLSDRLKHAGSSCQVLCGAERLVDVATLAEAHTVMAAIVGIAGLRPTLAAVNAGKQVLLANKEALVTAGPIFMNEVRTHHAALIPIDSEHNAIFQCLPAGYDGNLRAAGIRRVLLTASGGPFREYPVDKLSAVTPDQACAHPNWVMGRKISVDSATMMNKGLEIIEARWLFNAAEHEIDVIIHPESVIHSLVEYVDGSVLAQLGNPDMRTPIAQALGFPVRIEAGVSFLDLASTGRLNFSSPDERRFPCLRLAREVLRQGGRAPAVLNAANEIAVAAFLDLRMRFDQIPQLLEDVLHAVENAELHELADVFEADRRGRLEAEQWLETKAAKAPVPRMTA
jgi:1-deoxy-D-xylulose-5-phosphate reductoisomerase